MRHLGAKRRRLAARRQQGQGVRGKARCRRRVDPRKFVPGKKFQFLCNKQHVKTLGKIF